MNYIIVFITASSQEEAQRIADELVSSRLAACVNIVPGVRSVFMWQGKKETAQECLLVAKTKKSLFKELKEAVKKVHSYEVPEIISIDISEGNEDYLNWVEEAVGNR